MKLIRLNIVLFLLFINTIVIGQGFSSSINIPLSLGVYTGIVVKKVSGDLDYGSVLSTSTVQTLTNTPDKGVLFEVNATPKSKVIFNYSVSVNVSNNDWALSSGQPIGNMTFTPTVHQTQDNQTYINPVNLVNGNKVNLKKGNGIYSQFFIWVGGDINIQPNQPIGDYVGTFNITMAYN